MMSRVFEPFLGRTIEAYIGDILVKSRAREDHLKEAFSLLRQHRLLFNPDKCMFRVSSDFLGFLVNQRGIEIVQGHVSTISQMKPPMTYKRIQSLIK